MAVQNILIYPEPVLQKKAEPITDFGDETQQLVDDMVETVLASDNNLGLAAPQVGFSKRIVAIDAQKLEAGTAEKLQSDIGLKADELLILINPEIVEHSGENIHNEYCLSVPGIGVEVKRHEDIVLHYHDRHGEKKEIKTGGWFSYCIQHECEHLDGVVLVDHLSKLKRNRAIEKLNKYKKKLERRKK